MCSGLDDGCVAGDRSGSPFLGLLAALGMAVARALLPVALVAEGVRLGLRSVGMLCTDQAWVGPAGFERQGPSSETARNSVAAARAYLQAEPMGPVLILVSAVCFGAMGVFGKLAYDAGVPGPTLVLLRFALASVVLGAAVAALRARSGRPALPHAGVGRRRLVLTALALGGVGYAAQASFYFAALERIDAALVALVLYTFPVMVTIVSVLRGRDRLTPARVAALLAATAGTALVLVGAGAVSFDLAGVALAFAAAVTYTIYILVGETTVQRVPALTLTALVMSGATVTLAGRAALTGGVELDLGAEGWAWIACIALVSTVVASTTFFAGLRRTGPTAASILSTSEPVATVALAAVVLGERLTALQAVGAALVLSSVLLVQLRRRPEVDAPVPLVDAPVPAAERD